MATVLGIPIAPVDRAGAVERVVALMASGGHHQVVTVNPEFLVAARYRPTFAAILRRAALATADGVGILLAARLQGTPLQGRVTGTDLVVDLAQRAAELQWGIFLLGAAPGVAERAAETLRLGVPGVRVVGVWAGSPRADDEADILRRLAVARPDVLLVAYGAPAQELWLARNLAQTPAIIGIGVGGAFDFLAGVKPRAPQVLQRAGLEWLYRLLQEPWRARRMLALPAFVALVARDVLAQRLRRRSRAGDIN